MIRSFRDKETEVLFYSGESRRFQTVQKKARAKLGLVQTAGFLTDLRKPPGNRLEQLKGSRAGQHSIRINDQYRICFEWRENAAWNVEIVDYH